MTIWGEDRGITWDNAPENIKLSFATVRLFWFFRMTDIGGPDGSELDTEVVDKAREAAEWFGTVLDERVQRATS